MRLSQRLVEISRSEMVYFAYLDGRLGLAVEDLERGADAGLAEVPVLLVVVVAQQLHEPRNVHVVVVVEVTEPPATNTQRYNKTRDGSITTSYHRTFQKVNN